MNWHIVLSMYMVRSLQQIAHGFAHGFYAPLIPEIDLRVGWDFVRFDNPRVVSLDEQRCKPFYGMVVAEIDQAAVFPALDEPWIDIQNRRQVATDFRMTPEALVHPVAQFFDDTQQISHLICCEFD